MLTEPQIEAINDAIATLDRRGWPIDEYFAKVFREMLAAHSAGAQRVTNIPERQRGESFRDWAKRTYELQDAQPMPQTDAARDAEDAKRYRFIKSQMKVGAVQTQLPLYRTLHWIGYEDCSDVRNADAAIDAEIERLDRAKGE